MPPLNLFADVDDTICESTQPVSPAMAAELRRLAAAGTRLAFISGSTVEQLWGQLGPSLGGSFHLLGASGTHAVEVMDGRRRELYRHILADAERERVLEAFRGLARRHGLRSMTTEEDQVQDRGSQITFSAIGRHAPAEAKRAFDPDRRRRQAWVEELRPLIGPGFHIGIGGTSSIDVTKQGMDKGWGLREFLKRAGWKAEESVFFGDNLQPGGNDYPAKAVMACVEVRDVADALEKLKKY